MKSLAALTTATLTFAMCSGCSFFICKGGKDMARVFGPGKTNLEVRKELGTPVGQVTFPQPVPASDVPELYERMDALITLPLVGYEDYAYRGRVASSGKTAGCSMGVAMVDGPTLGLGELVLFPLSIAGAIRESREVHRFRVWYLLDRTCFDYIELTAKPAEPTGVPEWPWLFLAPPAAPWHWMPPENQSFPPWQPR